jgi:hypothetical protein
MPNRLLTREEVARDIAATIKSESQKLPPKDRADFHFAIASWLLGGMVQPPKKKRTRKEPPNE